MRFLNRILGSGITARLRETAVWGRDLSTRVTHPLPQFVVVGAQKGGTSSLYHYLVLHPRVLSAAVKAVHFFDIHYERGVPWYRRQFPSKLRLTTAKAMTGEASPYYLFHPHAAARMARVIPGARIIICLRNPLDRAISHYWDNVRRGKEILPMKEAFEAEAERLRGEEQKMQEDPLYRSWPHSRFSYIARGHYGAQVQRYLDHFDSDQILILRSEDLFTDTQRMYDDVCRFIGLEAHTLADAAPRNVGKYRREIDPLLERELTEHFEPHNQHLYELVGEHVRWPQSVPHGR